MCKLFLKLFLWCHSVLGPLLQARHSWGCPCFSSVPEANIRGEASGENCLEWRNVSSKSHSGIQEQDKGVLGSNGREQNPSRWRSMVCQPGNSRIFLQKANRKNCVSGQTWTAAKHWGRLTYHIRYYLQKKTFGKSDVLAVLQSVQGKNWVLSRMFKGAS